VTENKQVNIPKNPHILENSIRLNHNKLFNCQQDIHQKRVRSVVRISRRSSEPCRETVPQTVNGNSFINMKNENIRTAEQRSNTKKSNISVVDWDGYRDYLSNLNKSKKEIQNKIGYGRTYCYVLETGNAQGLMKVSNGCRVHTMRALSTLSKYMGCYDEWMKIVKKYQLRWKNGDYNSLNTFKNIFGIEGGNDQTLPQMMNWIKSSIAKLPKEVGNILMFNTLTGLRPDEAQKAVYLIKTKGKEYADTNKGLLLHYLYPNTFFRVTKKCYISIVNEDMLEIVNSIEQRESYYYTVRSAFDRTGMKMNMYYCRKVFATYLRNKGIEPEIIDLLQGRICSSVFVNHYYRPDINEIITKRIRPVLDELKRKMT